MNICWLEQTDHRSVLVFQFCSKIAFPDFLKPYHHPSKLPAILTHYPAPTNFLHLKLFLAPPKKYFFFFLYQCFYPHQSRESVFLVCGILTNPALKPGQSCLSNRPGSALQTPPSLIHSLFYSFSFSSFYSRSSKNHKSQTVRERLRKIPHTGDTGSLDRCGQ